MKSRMNSSRGQSLVETILLLPLLLILLAGSWWAFRNLSVSSAAESAAHAHLLRTGRGVPSIASKLSATLHSDGDRVQISGGNRPLSTKVPLFGDVSGNTNTYAGVSFPCEQVGGFIDLPKHEIRRDAEGAVDCWGKNSRSGSTIKGTVLGILATGAFR